MKTIGTLPSNTFLSPNTVQCGDRILSVSSSYDAYPKLVIYELFLGDKFKYAKLVTDISCSEATSCCVLGDQLLVLFVTNRKLQAYLIDVGSHMLDGMERYIARLTVDEPGEWPAVPFLCAIAGNRALLSFSEVSTAWFCDVVGDRLALRKFGLPFPFSRGADLPIRRSGTELVFAGASPGSDDITAIRVDKIHGFERLGHIAGIERRKASYCLIRNRFLIGFGGRHDSLLDDLWIFDLETGNSSVVWEKGAWHPGGCWVSLMTRNDVLYLIGGDHSRVVSRITLQAFSRLVSGDAVRAAFRSELGLDEAQKYVILPKAHTSSGMEAIGDPLKNWTSLNTTQYRDGVFHFSQHDGKLVISRLLLGPKLKAQSFSTGRNCGADDDNCICCCAMEDCMLVMTGKSGGSTCFAFLVSVEAGDLGPETVQITGLTVKTVQKWARFPQLVSLGQGRAWLVQNASGTYWECNVKINAHTGRGVLKAKKHKLTPLTQIWFAAPARLLNKKLVAVELSSSGTAIVSVDEHFRRQTLGLVFEQECFGPSLTLVKKRFVVGYGSLYDCAYGDIWIFDTLACTLTFLKKEGNWPVGVRLPFWHITSDSLYIIGGRDGSLSYCMSFQALESSNEVFLISRDFLPAVGFCAPFEVGEVTITTDTLHYPGPKSFLFNFHLSSAIVYRRRIFCFHLEDYRIAVAEISPEILLGYALLTPELDFGSRHISVMASSVLKDLVLVVLVLSSSAGDAPCQFYVARLQIEDGPVTKESVHLSDLCLIDQLSVLMEPRLILIDDTRMWLSFVGGQDNWLCTYENSRVRVEHMRYPFPRADSLCLSLSFLSEGTLIAANRYGELFAITLNPPKAPPAIKIIGMVPGGFASDLTLATIAGRFVIGVGSQIKQNIWIFDIETATAFLLRDDAPLYLPQLNLVLHAKKSLHFLSARCMILLVAVQLAPAFAYGDIVTRNFCAVLEYSKIEFPDSQGNTAAHNSKHEQPKPMVHLCNTVQHGSRVFSASGSGNKLIMTEYLMGEETKRVSACVNASTSAELRNVGCCVLGNRILIIGGLYQDGGMDGAEPWRSTVISIFAALFSISDVPFDWESVHLVKLNTSGFVGWYGQPFLCPLTDNRVLLYFHGQTSMICCTIHGRSLDMTQINLLDSSGHRFSCIPIRLPSGELLTAGGAPASTNISLISIRDQAVLEVIGHIPGKARKLASTILVSGRFILGFGGYSDTYLSDLWIFDLVTRKASRVQHTGLPDFPDGSVALAAWNSRLYFFGGQIYTDVVSISFSTLSLLIVDDAIRAAFSLSYDVFIKPVDFSANHIVIPKINHLTGLYQVVFYNSFLYSSHLTKLMISLRRRQASLDTKLRFVQAHFGHGFSVKDLCKRYGVSIVTGYTWIRRAVFGSLERKPGSGRPRKINSEILEEIRAILTKRPDSRLQDVRNALLPRYGDLSVETIRTAIVRDLDFSHAVAEKRWKLISRRSVEQYVEYFNKVRAFYHVDLADIVFVDEVSKDDRASIPTRVWGKVGSPHYYEGKYSRGARLSIIMFLSIRGIEYWTHTDGTFDSTKFGRAVVDFLAMQTKLRIIVLDGARIHWTAGMRKIYSMSSCIFIKLPPYCPFLNPIEQIFGIFKQYLRKNRESPDSLVLKTASFIDTVRGYTSLSTIMDHGYCDDEFVPVRFYDEWLCEKSPAFKARFTLLAEVYQHVLRLQGGPYQLPLAGQAPAEEPNEQSSTDWSESPDDADSQLYCQALPQTSPPGTPWSPPPSPPALEEPRQNVAEEPAGATGLGFPDLPPPEVAVEDDELLYWEESIDEFPDLGLNG